MKYIITEKQYRFLSEQPMLGVADVLLDPSNTNAEIFEPKSLGKCKKENPPKTMMSKLFTYCNKVPNSSNPKISQWNERLYKSMKGLGTGNDLINVFRELTSINDLASIWKTFKYENQNLWQWLDGEWKYSWESIWNAIPENVKTPAKIPRCLEFDNSQMS